MALHETLLEAYVQYELGRWSPDRLEATLREEIGVLFLWLGDATLNEVASPQKLTATIVRFLCETPITPELERVVEEGARAVHSALARDATPISELIPRARYDQVLEIVVGLKDLRREVIDNVTSSSVYAMLVADILYHGIKSFMLTDNVVARSLPGASSLIRFGQKTLNSAAPNLEKSIDRHVIAFINANIKTTISQSEAFLDRVLDDNMIWKMGAETWDAYAGRPVAEFAGYVDGSSVADLTDFALRMWAHVRTSETLRVCVEEVVTHFYVQRGDTPLRALLQSADLDAETVSCELAATLAPILAPVVQAAQHRGDAEALHRARFQAFLDWHAAHT